MAVLLVGLSVAAILMSAAMPVWRQMVRREKEAELVFRGEQYARAIGLFQRRSGPGVLPPSVDALVEGRFLRKKYKDPITDDDFAPILQGQALEGAPASGQTPQPPGGPRPSATQPAAQRPARFGVSATSGPIIGVVSKSKEKSIRLYNGRNYYNEWQFVFVPRAQTPGGEPDVGGPPGPGGRGGRGGPRGGPPAPGRRGERGGLRGARPPDR